MVINNKNMDTIKTVSIDLGTRGYDITIGAGVLAGVADLLPFNAADKSFFIVTDENVVAYAAQVQGALNAAGAGGVYIKTLPAGEATKSFDHARDVCAWMLDHGAARDACVVAVGGGVIGDLAGFAASIVMRGVDFVQVPTTVLSQVDSAVGGKTGINTPHGKNLIGAFYQPRAVIIDTDTLKTLPERQICAGYAEVVKYGLINDAAFFTRLEGGGEGSQVCALEHGALSDTIETSVRAKAKIVEADEREGGVRALLNLGHTFGHALEGACGYDGRLLHGEAVSIGMVMAFDLSVRMGICGADDLTRVKAHLSAIGLPIYAAQITPTMRASVDTLYAAMHRDKKVKDNVLHMILTRGIGAAFVCADAPAELTRAVLADSLAATT